MLLLCGCSVGRDQDPLRAHSGFRIEPFPFYEQVKHQCAPAALAMVLTYLGDPLQPSELTDELFTPQREGAFQSDLVAAARRRGKFAWVLPGDFDGLLKEVAAEHPVIVLLNLSFSWVPLFHYGVVIGHDAERDEIVFTSGRKENEIFSLRTFQDLWERGGNWGLLVTRPEVIPATANLQEFLSAAAALEEVAQYSAALRSYRRALAKWGELPVILIALGNAELFSENYAAAISWYDRALRQSAPSPALLNNYAWALAHEGRLTEARRYAEQAVELGGEKCGAHCADTLDFIKQLP